MVSKIFSSKDKSSTPLFIQLFLIFCLFFVFNGGAFLIGWEQFKHIRVLHRVLSVIFVIIGIVICYLLYTKDKDTFFNLEPMRSLRYFFGMPAVISVGLLTFLYFATQLTYLITMHAGFGTSLWDLGIYDQVIWNTAHGDFLVTSVRGGLHVFCEHFKPIIALLSSIYWFRNSSVLLFTVFTLITSSSIALSYLISKQLTASHLVSLIFAFCVFFYQPMRNGIDFLFHTQALADPFLLAGVCFVPKTQIKRAILFFLLALMCKENIAMDVLGIGLFFISRKVKSGWTISFLAMLFLVLFVFVIEPHFSYPYHFLNKWTTYAYFRNPSLEAWKSLLDPNPIVFLILVFAPFFFLSFKCKGWYWLLGPSLALRLLGNMPGLRLTTVHYTAGLNALVIISAIYGLAFYFENKKNERKSPTTILILLIFSAFLFSGKPQLFAIDRFLTDVSKQEVQAAVKVLESIPSKYSVLTNERTSAHLSHRSHLYVFFSMFPHAPLEDAVKHPDLVVEDVERVTDREREVVLGLVKEGYLLIFEHGFIRIYASPNIQIPQALMTEWEEFKQPPAVPYRRFVQFGYRSIFVVGILFVVGLLVRRNILTTY